MTKENQFFSKKFPQDATFLQALERIRMRHKLFRVIAYKLADGEIAITTRQMAIAVKKPPKAAKEFMRKMGINPIQVKMPNHAVTDMIPISIAVAFWKYLNESGKGNALTKFGQKYLDDYVIDSPI